MTKPIIKHGGILIVEGEKYDIIAAINTNGKSPFLNYFNNLKDKYIKKAAKNIKKRDKINIDFTILREYFNKFGDHGSWKNGNQIKSLENGFNEFKNNNTGLRVPFYYDKFNQRVIILTHYFYKNEQKTPPKEIKKMKEIKKQFEDYRQKLGGTQ